MSNNFFKAQAGASTAKIVIVDSISNFPTAVGGFVTLENATYMINADISTALKFKAPASGYCQMQSVGNHYTLTYTGAGALFEDPAMTGNLTLNLLQLSAPSGKIFDLVGTGENEVLMISSTVYDVAEIGTIKDMSSSFDFCLFLLWKQGLTIDGTSVYLDGSAIADGLNEVGSVMLTIQGSIRSIVISNNGFTTNGANERILDIKSTGTYDEGNVNINRFSVELGGQIYASGSLDHSFPVFDFVGNTGKEITNSSVVCSACLVENATVTDIPVVAAFTMLNASTWVEEPSIPLERGTLGVDGVFAYTGLSKINVVLDGNAAPDPTTASKKIKSRFLNIHSEVDFVVTFTNGTNIVNEVGTTRSTGDTLIFYGTEGTLPAELRKDTVYFVVNKLTDSFQLAYTEGGAVIPFTDDGTPINSYARATLVGSVPQQTITSSAPRDLVLQAYVTVEQGDKIGVVLQNLTDAVNLNCGNSYFRVAG